MNFGFKIRFPSLSRKISAKASLKRNLSIRKPTLLVNPEKAIKRKVANATTLKLGYKKTSGKDGKNYHFTNISSDENNPECRRISEDQYKFGTEKFENISDIQCPKCRSNNIGKITTYIIVFFCISALWFTISQSIFSFICLAVSISLFFMKKNYCRDCHYMFR